jgi:hypothetical protein
MMAIFKSIIWILLFGLLSCERDDQIKYYLDSITTDKYYSDEIVPANYQMIYGKWKLFKVSGGFAGDGYAPDYDYLELKSFGIYGLVKNDSLFEYGKIELDTLDYNTRKSLQIKFIPDFYKGLNPRMDQLEKYIDLKGADTLNLIAPCCDMYNYHYKKIK